MTQIKFYLSDGSIGFFWFYNSSFSVSYPYKEYRKRYNNINDFYNDEIAKKICINWKTFETKNILMLCPPMGDVA